MPQISDTIHVHVRSAVNMAGIREDVRNGRKVIVVPSATMPDDVVMNGIKYPADEIAKSFASLNRTPAPAGHPMFNGQFLSAYDPESMNHFHIGAWNENARHDGGRVLVDKVIDVEFAKKSERGNEVLNAISKGEPIHTSTGLTATLHEPEGDDHEFVARDIMFDHDAILIHEEGAATPAQGVGMLVNGKNCEVFNAEIDWTQEQLEWAVRAAHDALDEGRKAPLLERFKAAVIEAYKSLSTPAQHNSADDKGDADMADTERLEQLAGQVEAIGNALAELTKGLPGVIAEAVKPATEMVANLKAEAEAKDTAELADLRAKLVNAKLVDEAGAEHISLEAARALASNLPTKQGALNLNGKQANGGVTDDLEAYDINGTVDAVAKEKN